MLLARLHDLQVPCAFSPVGFAHFRHRASSCRRPISSSINGRSSGSIGEAVGAAEPLPLKGRVIRPKRKNTTSVDHAGVEAYLQDALDISHEAALDLVRRSSTNASSYLHLANCHAWVMFLRQLADGDVGAVRTFLLQRPRLLSLRANEPRLAQLQRHLQQTFDIEPPQLLVMVRREPGLLWSTLDTVTAASDFLLTQFGDDAVAVRKAVVAHPEMLCRSTSALQATLQWLTGRLGAPRELALRMLPKLAGSKVSSGLEPQRLWLLEHGFSAAQVLSVAQAAPSVLAHNLKGQLIQLKVQYWQHQLGYSLSDLSLVPNFLTYSLVRVASRHSALCHLGDAKPSHSRLQSALMAGTGSSLTHFGPNFYASFVKHCGAGSHSVQEVLLLLSASLGQPALRVEWETTLILTSPLNSSATSARKDGALYAALHAIQQRDWALSDASCQCVADEAAAKAADPATLAAQRTAAVVAKRSLRAPRKRLGSAVAARGALEPSAAALQEGAWQLK